MMISIDKASGEITYNPEYYLMNHLSHYDLLGANRLKPTGEEDHLAFVNPDGERVLFVFNIEQEDKEMTIEVEGKVLELTVKGNSMNTFTREN
ncbi:glycoside hydrolase family 30 beta sandwich domain-containing protein [Echinicola jeungdonensis]|uniref:Glycoside hydrolase family 30 beta sandwich domain-containing protein n=1 Tax=Echinicola jeungdonensis TaxID=709343 RepID=A0ABV5JC44_9BACT|nr:glycoside hydrolase family 30 beta sandwich domain-containing protein [Echinicola jeungdonensis]MDN3670433.1 glycoside hydrolase family 30 beta sandwich domain-containing protein [Echinicola jeungdonensis]